MKRTKSLLLACSLVVLAMTGCKNEDLAEHHYDNKLYIETQPVDADLLIKASIPTSSRTVSVRMAQPAETDVKVEFEARPQDAAYYNQIFGDNAFAMPAENFSLSATKVVIRAGAVTTDPITVNFVDTHKLNASLRYVLPVVIANVEGIDLLESRRAVYFVFHGAALIDVVADVAENYGKPSWKNPAPLRNMTTFTMEAFVNPNKFGRLISTIMGIEGKFLLRIGDAGVPDNQLQIATSNGNSSNADMQLPTGEWTHIAVTFDNGVVNCYMNGKNVLSNWNCRVSSVDIGKDNTAAETDSNRYFWVGYSYAADRYFDGKVSEYRIWNRALTADEINSQDHFYYVDNDAEGLVAYWKFCDGAGGVIKDYTENGNDILLIKTPTWINVSLPVL